jgi:hypothetical protein
VSIASLPRIVPLTLVLAVLVVAPARARVPAALGPDGRVFTLAGGGTEPAREGLPAHRVRLAVATPAALPDGDVALLAAPRRSPWLVGHDGRLHALPSLDRLRELAAGADGSLFAVRGDDDVHRLRPGAPAWERVLDASAAIPGWEAARDPFAGSDTVSGFTALPDGGFAIAWLDAGVWRSGPDGQPQQVALPEQTEAWALAALPTGELVVSVEDSGADSRLMIAPPGGPLRPLGRGVTGFANALAVPPVGGFLRTDYDDLFVHDAAGARIARIGTRDGPGPGDGGPAPAADLLAVDVDAGADGTVVAGDWLLRGFTSMDRGVIDPFMARLFLARPVRPAVRAFVAPGTARPLAALAPATFTTLREGEVVVRTTVAGRATVVVREAGREVARASADVAAGASALALDRGVPEGDLTVTLEVEGAAAVAGAALEVSTLRRLDAARARAAAERIETPLYLATDMELGPCRRASPRRFACAMVRPSGRCGGRIVVRQRADGRRLTLQRGRRSCRGA